jgi:tetratricopeptide (TPR) repeat protein
VVKKNKYWADQIEAQQQAALAFLACALGQDEEAVTDMRNAAELESSMDKHPVTPAAIVPMRELLGDLLLEVSQPAQALVAYEQSLASDPNRFRGIYGAATAADRSGDRAKANGYFLQLAELGSPADTQRPELAEAKAYLGQ